MRPLSCRALPLSDLRLSIAVLDLPGIIEGAASGRGRGRQVVAVAKVRAGPLDAAHSRTLTEGCSSQTADLVVVRVRNHFSSRYRALTLANLLLPQMMLDVTK